MPLSELLRYLAQPERGLTDSHLGIYGREGIEIRNHDLREVVEFLFADELYLKLRNSKRSFTQRLAGAKTLYTYEHFDRMGMQKVSLSMSPFGIKEFFGITGTLVDLGCGPGLAAIELAHLMPELTVIGVDYEFERQITQPWHQCSNLHFLGDSWEKTHIESASVERIISRSAAFTYGRPEKVVREVTRIAKPGALLRAEYMPLNKYKNLQSETRKKYSTGTIFAQTLLAAGWEVWKYNYTLIAQKK